MRHWITVQFPMLLNGKPRRWRIWLQDGRQSAGTNISPGDRVLVYETKSGPAELTREETGVKRKVRRARGRQGIIAVAVVSGQLERDPSEKPREYPDRPSALWCWVAPLSPVHEEGFVPLADVTRVLEYQPGSRLRGFGPHSSGLKEITSAQFTSLAELFPLNHGGKQAEDA